MQGSYNGKRVSPGRGSSPTRHSRKHGNPMLRVLYFPVLILYLELIFHIVMKASLKYLPIYLAFSLAGGLVFTAVTTPFRVRCNKALIKLITFLLSLTYIVETVCKQILQTYYPLSSLGTAAENQLTDYLDVIVPTVIRDIPLILLFLLPFILLLIFGRSLMGYRRYDIRFSGLCLAAALLLHLIGLGVIHLPWSGDIPPKKLYHMDTNIEDQVEQLGMLNMLRLDVKHMIVPARNPSDDDFSDLSTEQGGEGSSSEDTSVVEPEPDEPVIDTSPNVMDVDLAALAESTDNKDVQWLANFFNSLTPTKKNEYTGMFEGYNVIQLVLEGFSGYAIDPQLTPTLYKMANEGFVFHNFYTPLHFTSTSNGECQSLLGLYPKDGMPITMKRTGELGDNMYFSLAQQLKREGYKVLGYHANSNMYGRLVSHTNLGYDWRQEGSGLELEKNASGNALWPQKDTYLIEASADDYMYSSTPFHVYYLTISGHMPYSNNVVVKPYLDVVRKLPYTETTQNYVATAMEVDRAMALLLQKLEEAGQLDKTLIIASPDHIPYFDVASLEELSGKKFGSSADVERLNEENIDFDLYKSSLIMWSASMKEPVEIDKVCGQVDILPTVSNLLGLEYDSRMMAGSDALSDSEGMVVFSSRSWKTDKGFYNRYTQTFTPAPGVTMTAEEQEQYVKAKKKLVSYKLDSTVRIVENDFYNIVFGNKA